MVPEQVINHAILKQITSEIFLFVFFSGVEAFRLYIFHLSF